MGEPVHLTLDYSLVSLEAREPREGKSLFLWKEKGLVSLGIEIFPNKRGSSAGQLNSRISSLQ